MEKKEERGRNRKREEDEDGDGRDIYAIMISARVSAQPFK